MNPECSGFGGKNPRCVHQAMLLDKIEELSETPKRTNRPESTEQHSTGIAPHRASYQPNYSFSSSSLGHHPPTQARSPPQVKTNSTGRLNKWTKLRPRQRELKRNLSGNTNETHNILEIRDDVLYVWNADKCCIQTLNVGATRGKFDEDITYQRKSGFPERNLSRGSGSSVVRTGTRSLNRKIGVAGYGRGVVVVMVMVVVVVVEDEDEMVKSGWGVAGERGKRGSESNGDEEEGLRGGLLGVGCEGVTL
ncbi:hypothetical protein M0804_009256 [Polistes exclamans]|nr:hypothetical protein M0804_009256 [Polistes exclamans]